MSEKRKFFKTTLVLEILSEDVPIEGSMDLGDIAREMTTGDLEGVILDSKDEQIDAKTAAKLLIAHGSDPEFFSLRSNGVDIDTLSYTYHADYTQAEDEANRFAGDTGETYFVVDFYENYRMPATRFLVTNDDECVTETDCDGEVVYTVDPPINKDYRGTMAE